MEPLVVFGAFLVVYCGYLTFLDTPCLRVFGRVKKAAKRKPAKNKLTATTLPRRSRAGSGVPAVSPVSQKI